jgi:cobalamin biosynthesis protein CobD/CbiB
VHTLVLISAYPGSSSKRVARLLIHPVVEEDTTPGFAGTAFIIVAVAVAVAVAITVAVAVAIAVAFAFTVDIAVAVTLAITNAPPSRRPLRRHRCGPSRSCRRGRRLQL